MSEGEAIKNVSNFNLVGSANLVTWAATIHELYVSLEKSLVQNLFFSVTEPQQATNGCFDIISISGSGYLRTKLTLAADTCTYVAVRRDNERLIPVAQRIGTTLLLVDAGSGSQIN